MSYVAKHHDPASIWRIDSEFSANYFRLEKVARLLRSRLLP